MNLVLLLDTETTGTDNTTTCIEVAVSLYSLEHAAATRSYSSLIHAESNEAEKVNRIPVPLLAMATAAPIVWAHIARFGMGVDAVVCHGAEFDRRFVPASILNEVPWVCSCNDLEYPRWSSSRGLVALALAHDVGVSSAHRTMADVDILARLFTRVHEMGVDLRTMIERGLRPKAVFAVAAQGFDEARNALAKEHWFEWNKPRAPKQWSRNMAIDDVGALPFDVRRIEP